MYSQLFELHADLLKSLAHPRRLEIIQLLQDQELPVTDIHTMLDLPQANISQHLMILRDFDILKTRREGKQIYYQLTDPKILQACELIREFLIDHHQIDSNIPELQINMKQLVPLTHDPVCHMRVSPKTAGFSHKHKNQTYFFCASGCMKKFQVNPEKYILTMISQTLKQSFHN